MHRRCRCPVLLGLSPRGVCRAAPVARDAGALLPHPCTRDPDGPDSRRGRMVGAGLLSVARAVVPKVPTVVGTGYSARLPVRKRGALQCSDFPHRRTCADRNGSRSGRNDGAMARSARHLTCTVQEGRGSNLAPAPGLMQKSAAASTGGCASTDQGSLSSRRPSRCRDPDRR